MTSQATNCSQDVSEANCIDFEEIVFETDDYQHRPYNSLTIRTDNGLLNTPDFRLTNPFAPLNLGPSNDAINEPEIALGNVCEEIVSLILEIESSGTASNSTTHPMATANAPKDIEAIANYLRNSGDETTESQGIAHVRSFHHPYSTMSIRVQPHERQRFRYNTDGKRYLKNSRKNPMAINLPQLNGRLATAFQSFWILMTLVTSQRNPHSKVFYHQHKMFYAGENAEQVGLHSFRIPITEEEIRRQVKKFRYLSIIKTNQKDYNFQLVPFDPLVPDDHVLTYSVENEEQLTKIQKSKQFDETYHTEELRIVCQLLIKEDDQWCSTDLYCQTNVITDEAYDPRDQRRIVNY